MWGESIILSHQSSEALQRGSGVQLLFMTGRQPCFHFDIHISRTCTESNHTCYKELMELTIKMMACSITILSSINLTSILRALWYFLRQSDPSPLTPQLWPCPAWSKWHQGAINLVTSWPVFWSRRNISTHCHLSVSTDFISSTLIFSSYSFFRL